jgi:membrane protease YdiL (CAAX protease family)
MPSTRSPSPRRSGSSSGSGWTMQHRPLTVKRREQTGYFTLSQKPLHILAFLLPLIVLYEVGSARYLGYAANGAWETIRAQHMLLSFFQDFGLVGRFLPAVALITVLLASHTLHRDRWHVRPLVPLTMIVEAVVWTVPLIVLLGLVKLILEPSQAAALPPALAMPLADLYAKPWPARATVALGAGLYEELVFRMIGITALHLVFVDLARLKEGTGRLLAILVSAAAFTAYHDAVWQGGAINLAQAIPYFVAGAYFGAIYLSRGFGIVVGVHAAYDLFVLLNP